ncbi:MAG: gamma carbonic anhydrase family protein [Leptospirales bacterium]|jgi:carbonic anhydrase/acetyltransferase-like protein (isoleucine patch superfamily)
MQNDQAAAKLKNWRDYVTIEGEGENAAFIHPGAVVEGRVTLGEGSSIWAGAVLRGDLGSIRLGRFVNIQDNTTLHVDSRSPMDIGDYTLVGHNVMLHGCKIGRGCMIGIGSIVLDKAVIGDGAMVTAGCMIRGGKKIPPRALVVNKDGQTRVIENGAKTDYAVAGSLEYAELARRYRAGVLRPFDRDEELEFLNRAREIIGQEKI